jgi:hypothetical protein
MDEKDSKTEESEVYLSYPPYLSRSSMSAKQIKNEIRQLDQIDKVEIYRWTGVQIHAADLLSGIGVYRPLAIDRGVDRICRVIS